MADLKNSKQSHPVSEQEKKQTKRKIIWNIVLVLGLLVFLYLLFSGTYASMLGF